MYSVVWNCWCFIAIGNMSTMVLRFVMKDVSSILRAQGANLLILFCIAKRLICERRQTSYRWLAPLIHRMKKMVAGVSSRRSCGGGGSQDSDVIYYRPMQGVARSPVVT